MYHTLIEPLADIRERMQKFHTYQIAEASGLHPNTVRAVKNGANLNATLGTIEKIGNALDKLESEL